jgi:hypothetical protein
MNQCVREPGKIKAGSQLKPMTAFKKRNNEAPCLPEITIASRLFFLKEKH